MFTIGELNTIRNAMVDYYGKTDFERVHQQKIIERCEEFLLDHEHQLHQHIAKQEQP